MKYDELASIFPKLLQEVLEELQVDTKELQELRIRVERPVLAVSHNREYRSKTAVKRGELQEILAYLSNYSLYAYEDEVRCGFLSLP